MHYVGIDWAYARAAWCAKESGGAIAEEGFVPADEDGLGRLVLKLGPDVRACLEMMSGAAWVQDRLAAAGWEVEVADARRMTNPAPLACKTDKVDVRVPAELCRRDLVPALWMPPLEERALRERLRRRLHLVRLRSSAKNRIKPSRPARITDRAAPKRRKRNEQPSRQRAQKGALTTGPRSKRDARQGPGLTGRRRGQRGRSLSVKAPRAAHGRSTPARVFASRSATRSGWVCRASDPASFYSGWAAAGDGGRGLSRAELACSR